MEGFDWTVPDAVQGQGSYRSAPPTTSLSKISTRVASGEMGLGHGHGLER